jgi:peroxiredoxin
VCRYSGAEYASHMNEQPTPLPPGTPAPDSILPHSRYAAPSLNGFRGLRIVLTSDPADREPVSGERFAFYQEYMPTFQDLGTEVIGIPTGVIWCHAAFARETRVRFPIVGDSHVEGAIASAYSVRLKCKGSSSQALLVIDERVSPAEVKHIPGSHPSGGDSCALWRSRGLSRRLISQPMLEGGDASARHYSRTRYLAER